MQIIRNDDWKSRTAVVRDIMPGPGEYSAPEIGKGGGAAWGKYKPKSDVEWMMYRAAQIPGPGAYKLKDIGEDTKGVCPMHGLLV